MIGALGGLAFVVATLAVALTLTDCALRWWSALAVLRDAERKLKR